MAGWTGQVVPEPVDQWQSVGENGDNVLDAFYKEPQRYAYTFQNYVFVTRMMQVRIALLHNSNRSHVFCAVSEATRVKYIYLSAVSPPPLLSLSLPIPLSLL